MIIRTHPQKRAASHSEKCKEREDWFPLGYAQHCFWFVATALGDTANNQASILIEGELRTTVLEQAINTLIQSHISLRTEILDYAPMQRLGQIREFDLPFKDLSGHCFDGNGVDKQEQFIIRTIRQLSDTPFDLKAPPHLRAQLFRLEKSKHLLLICFPHIVADGGAIHLFEQQLWHLYAQGCHGEKMSLGHRDKNQPKRMQIDEWVSRERATYHRRQRQVRDFWRHHLIGYPYARFPACYLNQDSLTDHELYLPFPDNSYDLLNILAKQQRATLQMVFMTLVSEVVYAMTGQTRFSLNSVLEGREQPGSEILMAPTLRVMPVPVDMEKTGIKNKNKEDKKTEEGMATIALLEHIREKILSAYDHMECPWSLPVGVLAEQRWHNSPKLYSLAIRTGSWLYSKIFRRARLYPHFLADFLFMEPRPPQSIISRIKRSVEISQPTININILQDVFKPVVADNSPGGLHLSSYRKSEHREYQSLSSQAISTRWENDSINIYVTLSEDGKPIMQINCCCFNQAGMARFTGLLKEKLSSLSLLIPYGFQVASRRQGNESSGA